MVDAKTGDYNIATARQMVTVYSDLNAITQDRLFAREDIDRKELETLNNDAKVIKSKVRDYFREFVKDLSAQLTESGGVDPAIRNQASEFRALMISAAPQGVIADDVLMSAAYANLVKLSS